MHSVIAVLKGEQGLDLVNLNGNINRFVGLDLSVEAVFPQSPAIDTPLFVPSGVKSFYQQAFDSLQRGNFDAAGMMFRKALESALKDIHPEGKGRLIDRIDKLPDNIGVTETMKNWAHEVRSIGNESAHDDEPEIETDVRATYNFTNMFLKYAYEMPGLLKKRKEPSEPEE